MANAIKKIRNRKLHKAAEMTNILKELRIENKYTQEFVALKLEISRQMVCSIEKQENLPSLILAFKIAELFNLKVDDIFMFKK